MGAVYIIVLYDSMYVYILHYSIVSLKLYHHGGGMLRSLQIFCANLSAISVWRGTDDVSLPAGLK